MRVIPGAPKNDWGLQNRAGYLLLMLVRPKARLLL